MSAGVPDDRNFRVVEAVADGVEVTPAVVGRFQGTIGGAGRSSLERVRRKLAAAPNGDRQMVEILTAVLSDGLPAAEAACSEALREGVHSAAVILNILARRREPSAPLTIMTPDALRLRHAPTADCTLYDSLRRPE
jgi:hypothetical protein